MFGEASEFGVDELVAIEIVEADAAFFGGRLRHELFLLGDAQGGDDGLGDAALFYEVAFGGGGEGGSEGGEHGALEVLRYGGGTTLAGGEAFAFCTFFGIVGHVEVGAAVVAVAVASADVDPQRAVALVATGRLTFFTDCLEDTI